MRNLARLLAVWSALLCYAVYLVTIVGGGAAYPGYSHIAQYISELGATGAPHARLVSLGGFGGAGVLMGVYAVTAFLALPRSVASAAGFALILLFAVGFVLTGVYPCDAGCRFDAPSQSQMLHNLWGGISYMTAPLALVLLGVASRRWPGGNFLPPLGVVSAAIVAVCFAIMVGEGPWRGLAQRVMEAALAAWILASAAYLHRRPAT